MLPSPMSALLLNVTSDTYHWGCFGTSTALLNGLVEHGYDVGELSANATAALDPSPRSIQDLTDDEFYRRFREGNPALMNELERVELVVVNGEGTLHGRTKRALNLLYVMMIAKTRLGKAVQLVNHSCYPLDSPDPCGPVEAQIYKVAYDAIDFVASRETRSTTILSSLGVEVTQSFDCLADHIWSAPRPTHGPPVFDLLLSGGVTLAPDHALFRELKTQIGALTRVDARSLSEWLECIARSKCLVSGRFHHSLAAAFVQTPFVVWPSNTPKIDALCEMLHVAAPVRVGATDTHTRLVSSIRHALSENGPVVPITTLDALAALARRNFDGLPFEKLAQWEKSA